VHRAREARWNDDPLGCDQREVAARLVEMAGIAIAVHFGNARAWHQRILDVHQVRGHDVGMGSQRLVGVADADARATNLKPRCAFTSTR